MSLCRQYCAGRMQIMAIVKAPKTAEGNCYEF